MQSVLVIPQLLTASFGFAAFLLGAGLTRRIAVLREFNIPEPVTGGVLAAMAFAVFSALFEVDLEFSLNVRDMFLVMFFASIGLNARLSDLVSGGRPLALLLVMTIAIIVLQNVVGIIGANVFEMSPKLGVMFGSAALIGGHGTAIAWAPEVQAATGVAKSSEIGLAVATLGLVVAALLGGPVARFLINRHGLTPARPDEEHTVGLGFEDDSAKPQITHISLMKVMLALNLSVIFGYGLHGAIAEMGLKLPLFVPCLLMGIVVGNLQGLVMAPQYQVSRTPTLAVVSDFTLGTFLAISLMSIDLAALKGLGGPVLAIVVAQAVVAVLFVIYVLFPLLGRGYRAAVLAAGFSGFALGATPTAIANMTAVTKRYGPSPVAFVVLPLVSAFFVDIANAVVIQMIVNF